MPTFFVQCFEAGRWDGQDQRKVEAATAQEAAEAVCSEKLAEGAKLGTLRAKVTPLQKPQIAVTFRRADT